VQRKGLTMSPIAIDGAGKKTEKTESPPKTVKSTGMNGHLVLGRLGSSGYLMNIPTSDRSRDESASD